MNANTLFLNYEESRLSLLYEDDNIALFQIHIPYPKSVYISFFIGTLGIFFFSIITYILLGRIIWSIVFLIMGIFFGWNTFVMIKINRGYKNNSFSDLDKQQLKISLFVYLENKNIEKLLGKKIPYNYWALDYTTRKSLILFDILFAALHKTDVEAFKTFFKINISLLTKHLYLKGNNQVVIIIDDKTISVPIIPKNPYGLPTNLNILLKNLDLLSKDLKFEIV